MTVTKGFATLRFSTLGLAKEDRVAAWREQYGPLSLGIDVEPAFDVAFETSLTARALPDLQLLSAEMSAARVTRTGDVADVSDDLTLVVNRTGAVAAFARSREVVLREGEATLMRSHEVTEFNRYLSGGSLSIRIPRSGLLPLVVDADDAAMRLISPQSEALRLLTEYADKLLDNHALASPALRGAVVTHVQDLVALVLGATSDASEVAGKRGMRAARLLSAKSFIAENCYNGDLSIATVAAHLGIGPRNLQRLFERGGETFSTFVLAQRLARAHRMLTDPLFAHCSVSVIAYDVGFNDLSYFNRCFRRRYGGTPSDIREASAR